MKQKVRKYISFMVVLLFQSLILAGCAEKVTDETVEVKMNDTDVMVYDFERKTYDQGVEPYEIMKHPMHGTVKIVPGTIQKRVCIPGLGCSYVGFEVYKVLYTPATDYIGEDSIRLIEKSYSDEDLNKTTSTTTTININVIKSDLTRSDYNNAPIAYDKNISIDYETETDFTITGSDKDNDTFTFVIESNTSNGTIVLMDETMGDVTYMPNQGYSGADHFTFKVVDENNASSNVADVNITVKSLCDLDPSSSGCPGDPCVLDPTTTPGCPGYDPCLLDPTATGCPLDPCILDPQSSPTCPGYDPCLLDPTATGCPLDPCIVAPLSQECQDSISNNLP